MDAADFSALTDDQYSEAERTMRQAPAGRSSQYTGVPRARHIGSEKPLTN